MGSNPIWNSDFFPVYVLPRIYIIPLLLQFLFYPGQSIQNSRKNILIETRCPFQDLLYSKTAVFIFFLSHNFWTKSIAKRLLLARTRFPRETKSWSYHYANTWFVTFVARWINIFWEIYVFQQYFSYIIDKLFKIHFKLFFQYQNGKAL